ncbi:hypothetical protein K438DRAFT_2136543 [Mycena galopus ATCC 62051]|nr:hypothetical protein K438DRAFT_2136543 [Mycena galopus ATCC 62051]
MSCFWNKPAFLSAVRHSLLISVTPSLPSRPAQDQDLAPDGSEVDFGQGGLYGRTGESLGARLGGFEFARVFCPPRELRGPVAYVLLPFPALPVDARAARPPPLDTDSALVLVFAAQYDNGPKLKEMIVESESDLAQVCSDVDENYFNSSSGECPLFYVPRPTEPILIRELYALGTQELRKRYPFVLPSLLPERALKTQF